jgi:hypothetical protein
MCDLTIDGAEGGLKRGNTAMMIREGYDGRKDRKRFKGLASLRLVLSKWAGVGDWWGYWSDPTHSGLGGF